MPPDMEEQVEEIMRALRVGSKSHPSEDQVREWIDPSDPIPVNMQRVSQKLKQYGS